MSTPAREVEDVAPARPQEESEETWEEKEDKLAPEKGQAADQKYRYKEGELCLGPDFCLDPPSMDPVVGRVGVAWSSCPKPHVLLPSRPQAWHGVGNRDPSARSLAGGRELVASGFLSKQAASCSWCTRLGQLCGCLHPTSLVPGWAWTCRSLR